MLKMMIEGLDRSNEMIAKHLQEYEQSESELTIGEKIELINELKPCWMEDQTFQRYDIRGNKEKFIPVWKQLEDFVPMSSIEEDLKEKMQLVRVEEVYVEALQVKHPIIDWEIHSEDKKDSWKIIRLGGHTAVYQFFVDMLKQFDRENLQQLWALVKETLKRSTELRSNDIEEMVNVLTSMEAANILTSGVAAVSVPPITGVLTVGVPTVSGLVPTFSAIFTTASVVTPYSRRPRGISAKDKGKKKVVESEEPKKKKLQGQIDAQVAKEMKEEIVREDQRMNEQLVRDAEIARIHAEEEVKMMIEGLDKSNEMIARHLQEYEQSEAELTIREKIDLINELEQREFYMSVLKSHARWKTKHFRGMTLEEIKEKFIPVWKQLEDFVPMSSTEKGKRMKRKGLKLDERSAKRMKTSEDVSEEDLKEMMQLVPVEEFDREDLHQLWILVKKTLSIKQATKDKEKELWVELERLFEPDFEDQLWTHNQNLMHDPLGWRLYDTCGVHHVFTKDQEIFMLVKRDYPLRRGLAIVMISNKLQV
nr:hypothetical protein [Tanacetum cinerariifolium]